jgi:hypothetical protein
MKTVFICYAPDPLTENTSEVLSDYTRFEVHTHWYTDSQGYPCVRSPLTITHPPTVVESEYLYGYLLQQKVTHCISEDIMEDTEVHTVGELHQVMDSFF